MQRRLLMTAGLALLVLASAGVSNAQAILDGKVTGTVMSPDGAILPDATVELAGPALLGGSRTATTNTKGSYVFLNVPIGTYRVTVSRDGFKTTAREKIVVTAAAVATVDFTLAMGVVSETLTVSAEGPVVDSKTSTIDSKLGRQMLDRLPTSRDAFYDLTLTTPGMFDVGSSGSWLPSPTAYGGASNENVFLVNGVNTTNPRGASWGSLVKVNYDAVEEVRVVALGSRAEYGSYSGAAIDVLTRSGSNDYHGTVAAYSQLGTPASNQPQPGEDLGAPWLYVGEGEQLSGESKSNWEGNFTLGGPIVHDKLWFFAAYEHVQSKTLPPRWSLENTYKGRYADLKLSAAPAKNHQAWVSYHYENNEGTGWSWGTEPNWDTTMTYGQKTKNNTVSAQWQYFPASKTVLSAKYLGFWTDDDPFIPSNAPSHPGYINWWKWAQYGINGAFPYVEAQKSNRQTLQGDVSYFAENFLGQHDIKFGAQYTKGRGNWQGGYFQNYVNFLYPYRWTQDVANMQNWYGDTGLVFYNNKETMNPFLTVRTADSLGFFLDDQWSPSRRLTINLGLRFDNMSTRYGTGEIYGLVNTPAEINDPPPVVRERAGSDDLFNFNTVSPRIGVSYSLTEDGKTVARASYGRYYMPLSVEFLRRFGPDMPQVTREQQLFSVGPWSAVDTDANGTIDTIETRNAARMVYGMTPYRVSTSTRDPSWSLNVADGVKDQFTDQFTVNLEREIARNLSLSGTYIYKHAGDMFANIPINRVTGQEWEYERIPYTTAAGQTVQLYSIVNQDYNGDGQVNGTDVQWVKDNNTFQVRNMGSYDGVKPKRDFHAFQLVLNKRYADRWQGLASFVYSTSDGMASRTMRQDINIEGPMVTDDTWMGSLNYTINNMTGMLPFTPKFEFKASGSYKVPKLELDLGLRFRMHTGRPVWKWEEYPQHTQWADPAGGVLDPGGVGRIIGVTEPDDMPTLAILDLRLEKQFKLGGSKSINFAIDGFNLFNTNTPTNIDYQWEYGKVTGIPDSRRFRGTARFTF
jgi:carboxypeptidase family protein/TonB-dependent receptor-like protein